ncbi:unnamed protein product, partial [Heterotrigona itama]
LITFLHAVWPPWCLWCVYIYIDFNGDCDIQDIEQHFLTLIA